MKRKPDWGALATSEAEWWTNAAPADKIRVADELRKQVVTSTEGRWPEKAERKRDLEAHAKVAALLRRTRRTGGVARSPVRRALSKTR